MSINATGMTVIEVIQEEEWWGTLRVRTDFFFFLVFSFVYFHDAGTTL
jgi:hypothetical protein